MVLDKEERKTCTKALYTEYVCVYTHTHNKDIDTQMFTSIKRMTKFLYFKIRKFRIYRLCTLNLLTHIQKI